MIAEHKRPAELYNSPSTFASQTQIKLERCSNSWGFRLSAVSFPSSRAHIGFFWTLHWLSWVRSRVTSCFNSLRVLPALPTTEDASGNCE